MYFISIFFFLSFFVRKLQDNKVLILTSTVRTLHVFLNISQTSAYATFDNKQFDIPDKMFNTCSNKGKLIIQENTTYSVRSFVLIYRIS